MNNQLVLNFGGINLLLPKNKTEEYFCVPIPLLSNLDHQNNNDHQIFNGYVGDHMIWIPRSSIPFFYDPK